MVAWHMCMHLALHGLEPKQPSVGWLRRSWTWLRAGELQQVRAAGPDLV